MEKVSAVLALAALMALGTGALLRSLHVTVVAVLVLVISALLLSLHDLRGNDK
jgi:hypothetical protein